MTALNSAELGRHRCRTVSHYRQQVVGKCERSPLALMDLPMLTWANMIKVTDI